MALNEAVDPSFAFASLSEMIKIRFFLIGASFVDEAVRPPPMVFSAKSTNLRYAHSARSSRISETTTEIGTSAFPSNTQTLMSM